MTRTDIQQALRKIEEQLQELRQEYKKHEEELKAAEAQNAEEAECKAEAQKQLETKRQERINSELQRKEEALRQAEAQKAEEDKLRKQELAKDRRLIIAVISVAMTALAFIVYQQRHMTDDDFLKLCRVGNTKQVNCIPNLLLLSFSIFR